MNRVQYAPGRLRGPTVPSIQRFSRRHAYEVAHARIDARVRGRDQVYGFGVFDRTAWLIAGCGCRRPRVPRTVVFLAVGLRLQAGSAAGQRNAFLGDGEDRVEGRLVDAVSM